MTDKIVFSKSDLADESKLLALGAGDLNLTHKICHSDATEVQAEVISETKRLMFQFDQPWDKAFAEVCRTHPQLIKLARLSVADGPADADVELT
jgi:G3E family GTPase